MFSFESSSMFSSVPFSALADARASLRVKLDQMARRDRDGIDLASVNDDGVPSGGTRSPCGGGRERAPTRSRNLFARRSMRPACICILRTTPLCLRLTKSLETKCPSGRGAGCGSPPMWWAPVSPRHVAKEKLDAPGCPGGCDGTHHGRSQRAAHARRWCIACHYHAYELVPTVEELVGWIESFDKRTHWGHTRDGARSRTVFFLRFL